MRMGTKALAVAVGAVPLLVAGAGPAAADQVLATESINFRRENVDHTCTYQGTSEVLYSGSVNPPLTIGATTDLVDDHNDPVCRSNGWAYVVVRFRRAGSSTFESVLSTSNQNDFGARVSLQLQGDVADVNVEHGAFYVCDTSRPPCEFSFTTNPK
jgi:hypothetical protein